MRMFSGSEREEQQGGGEGGKEEERGRGKEGGKGRERKVKGWGEIGRAHV